MLKPWICTIGGEAGFGSLSTGLTLAKVATRSGYEVFGYAEYPSIIRGGHTVTQIVVGKKPVAAPYRQTDFLIALNNDTIHRHLGELNAEGYLIYDPDQQVDLTDIPAGVKQIAIPLNKLAREAGGNLVTRNSVALGCLMGLVGGDLKILLTLLEEEFKAKKKVAEPAWSKGEAPPKVIRQDLSKRNQQAARAGYRQAIENYHSQIQTLLTPQLKRSERIVVTGNEAIALGAIGAGLQFASIYPMTPTSSILNVLARHQTAASFIYKQPEDEISAITMAIGASFAGARAMVATAGGGFCLMTEAYGLAAMTETPLVIVVGMRGGPATGLPTWTEQGDLQFVLHAHQGTFPRFVLAPGDAEEAFAFTADAFNLADKYQTPVIILVDKHLCESYFSPPPFSSQHYHVERGKIQKTFQPKYDRYALSPDGISPRAFPGSGNHILANSDEHNEHGYSNEGAANRVAMMDKRLQKLATCVAEDMPEPAVYGPREAKLTIVSWGSNKGAILAALNYFPGVNFLHLTWLSPFPTEFVRNFLTRGQKTALFEVNADGQLHSLIKEKTGLTIEHLFLKYDGRPFFGEEVCEFISKIAE